ncbi:MAG: F0F1 ATP synthase subunit gamma [Candidatus Nanopelagicales bacterium]|nr:F0F1 ATP synthase subunit gamma [Candidatus Nanopelagicales bacterium]
MGAQQRIFKQRIKDTQSTKKITRAMELIASSRIVKAQAAVQSTAPYARALYNALTLAASHAQVNHTLLTAEEKPKRAAILVITADRGLAGAYSSNAIKEAEALAENLRAKDIEPVFFVVGRKGVSFYKFRERPIADSWVGFSDNPKYANAKEAAGALLEAYLKPADEGGVDEVHGVYTEFVNRVTQVPRALQVLPLQVVEEVVDVSGSHISGGEEKGGSAAWPLYDFEPDATTTLDALLPRYIEHLLYVGMLQSAASEHAARQRAMKSATDNAEDLIRRYTRQANQARQAEITQEISEIVGGADALASTN